MNNKQNLIVSESFYSIQGEGKSCGLPAVFLRLAGCNLLCKSENWICDSIEVWKKGIKTPFEEVLSPYMKHLKSGARLIITGGEPMLHQKKIIEYLDWFQRTNGFLPHVEIETNGTFAPLQEIKQYIFQFNVSPKLENSGETKERRYNLEALKELAVLHSQFKFVVSNSEDIYEIRKDFAFMLSRHQIWLMPAGETREELEKTREMTVELCKKYFYNFTDRAHITIWNKKTGV